MEIYELYDDRHNKSNITWNTKDERKEVSEYNTQTLAEVVMRSKMVGSLHLIFIFFF